ncbi:thioredoxin [Candidatus Peregrinibacteria bacterium]|nr:thioredoxin [Candidatus Peregrinibacteria bacterium]
MLKCSYFINKNLYMAVPHFTDATFEAEVLKSDVPVLVDFYAEWCGPCKMMGPAIEKLAAEYEGKVKIGKLNVDENPENMEKYGVQSIPTIILFKKGQVAEQAVGFQSEENLRKKFLQETDGGEMKMAA